MHPAAATPPHYDRFKEVIGISSFSDAAFCETAARIARHPSHLGRAESTEFFSEIRRWRRFFTPCALYGYRLGANTSILSRYQYATQDDLFSVDACGVTRNALAPTDTLSLVRDAKARGAAVVGFFGGSAVQGYGARLPQFTIPAQVERLLAARHHVDAVCINFGVAGWTCSQALLLLLHEAAPLLNGAVFYDGWNCCYDLFLKSVASCHAPHRRGPCHAHPGTTLRHIEADYISDLQFDVAHLSWRVLRLMVNRALSYLADASGSRALRGGCDHVLRYYFSLADGSRLRHRLTSLVLSPLAEQEALDHAADEYLSIHRKIATLCHAYGIRDWHVFQPLLANSSKAMHPHEHTFVSSGLPFGKPHLAKEFRQRVTLSTVVDFSDTFDAVDDQVFIDGGHLTMVGNFHVAMRLADMIAPELNEPRRK